MVYEGCFGGSAEQRHGGVKMIDTGSLAHSEYKQFAGELLYLGIRHTIELIGKKTNDLPTNLPRIFTDFTRRYS